MSEDGVRAHHRLDHSPFLVKPGAPVDLKQFDPAYSAGLRNKDEARVALLDDVSTLSEMQELLWASGRFAVLIIFQAMDAAGKDGTIKHVMTGVNPQGCSVVSFKVPSETERKHHFLWRPVAHLPPRGHITIFNRSYYEEVLVVRVHPAFLESQWVFASLKGAPDAKFWRRRFEQINQFESELVATGTVVLKFFLHVSREEQRSRFIERLSDPKKLWKFTPADYAERAHWVDYRVAYEDMLTATSTEDAPWYVIPADRKWFARACVADIIASRLQELGMKYPSLSPSQQAEFAGLREKLVAEAAREESGPHV
jgi:PPK2 family polyphosphate:nucleotide phosphotransferase